MVAIPERMLPKAVYVPLDGDFVIYRGSPTEMVAKIAEEMGGGSIEEAVNGVLLSLAVHRKVLIELPVGLDDHGLSEHFLGALVATKVLRPMAEA